MELERFASFVFPIISARLVFFCMRAFAIAIKQFSVVAPSLSTLGRWSSLPYMYLDAGTSNH